MKTINPFKIKTLVKREMEGNPLNLWFKQQAYSRSHRVDSSLTPHKKELQTLIKDGVLVVENFLEGETVDNIISELGPVMSQVQDDTFQGSNHISRNPVSGVYRIRKASHLSSASHAFFENPMIFSLAQSYVSENVKSFMHLAEIKNGLHTTGKSVASISDISHFDNWKFGFKAFLYLTDVGEDEAPFVYIKGSQVLAQNGTQFKKYLDFSKHGPHAGYYTVQQVENLKKEYGFEETVCTGKRGTLILADTRGIHRGTPLRQNHRFLLANYFQ